MEQEQIQTVLAVLKQMKDLELTLSDFYRICGEVWILEKDFWTHMADSEVKHAHNIDEIMKMFSEAPQIFELGYPFKRPAVQTFISGVKSNIERLKAESLPKQKVLFVARDIEESVLESRYAEIIRSDDKEFQRLIKQLVSDTALHKESLNQRIRGSNLRSSQSPESEVR